MVEANREEALLQNEIKDLSLRLHEIYDAKLMGEMGMQEERYYNSTNQVRGVTITLTLTP